MKKAIDDFELKKLCNDDYYGHQIIRKRIYDSATECRCKEYRERLEFSPFGDDKIDELEEANRQLKFQNDVLLSKIKKLEKRYFVTLKNLGADEKERIEILKEIYESEE